jgi:hypothetical protein
MDPAAALLEYATSKAGHGLATQIPGATEVALTRF